MNFKDELLFDNPWISLRKITHEKSEHGYVYSHEARCHGMIVSVLPFRKLGRRSSECPGSLEFLLRSEVTPSWGVLPILSTITGGVECPFPWEDAVRELKEEAGYEPPNGKFISLGECRGSKSSDSRYYLFAVDLTDTIQGKATGDGSGLETDGTVQWVTERKIAECVDPLASTIYVRFINKYYLDL